MTPFVRTVLGDLDPQTLHACDAHEHVWIGPSHTTAAYPHLRLDDTARIVTELRSLRDAGADWLIDCMPGETGRDLSRLADVSRASGVAVVASTGAHLAQYYHPDSRILSASTDTLASLFCSEILTGGVGTTIRCGIIKVAGSRDHLTDFEHRVFTAAAIAHRSTGVPIITHTEQGTAALEQLRLLVTEGGCDPSRVTLSHVDRIPDLDYHRQLLRSGINLEYDGHFRWKSPSPNPTVELIATLLPEFPTQIVVGMDAARSAYWSSYAGSPGLTYLLTTLRDLLLSRGVPEPLLRRLYTDNPRHAFSFARGPS